MTRPFNLADLFELVADTVPDRLALVAGSVRLPYAELDARANRFAHHLINSGVAPKAHFGILARNRAEWVEAMIGCYKSRTVPINLDHRYVAPELRYVVDSADLQVLVYERELSQLLADSWDASADRMSRLVVIEDGTPSSELDPVVAAATSTTGGVPTRYEEALAESTAEREFGPRSPDDLYVLFTGGTTGMPKGVMWRQEDIFFAAMGAGGWGAEPITSADELAGRLNVDPARRIPMLVVGPLMHGNAQRAMWNAFMMAGTTVL
jgi:acyl-CoA synthetase (AMP-forming)/AMP-acid ligase II